MRKIPLRVHHETEYSEPEFPSVMVVEITDRLVELLRTMRQMLAARPEGDHIYMVKAAHWQNRLYAGPIDVDDFDDNGEPLPDVREELLEPWSADSCSLNVTLGRCNWSGYLKHCGVAIHTDHIYFDDAHTEGLPVVRLDEETP